MILLRKLEDTLRGLFTHREGPHPIHVSATTTFPLRNLRVVEESVFFAMFDRDCGVPLFGAGERGSGALRPASCKEFELGDHHAGT